MRIHCGKILKNSYVVFNCQIIEHLMGTIFRYWKELHRAGGAKIRNTEGLTRGGEGEMLAIKQTCAGLLLAHVCYGLMPFWQSSLMPVFGSPDAAWVEFPDVSFRIPCYWFSDSLMPVFGFSATVFFNGWWLYLLSVPPRRITGPIRPDGRRSSSFDQ